MRDKQRKRWPNIILTLTPLAIVFFLPYIVFWVWLVPLWIRGRCRSSREAWCCPLMVKGWTHWWPWPWQPWPLRGWGQRSPHAGWGRVFKLHDFHLEKEYGIPIKISTTPRRNYSSQKLPLRYELVQNQVLFQHFRPVQKCMLGGNEDTKYSMQFSGFLKYHPVDWVISSSFSNNNSKGQKLQNWIF